MSKLIQLLFFFALFVNCSSDEIDLPENSKKFYWIATTCSDPWHYKYLRSAEQNDQTLKEAIASYLTKNKVIANPSWIKLNFDHEFNITCEACTCPTGMIIEVNADSAFQDKMKTLGFLPAHPSYLSDLTNWPPVPKQSYWTPYAWVLT
ncbi:MAG: hypothetical protein MI784_11700 [Cytophagales bacterium]|nr:hypothetical protein [Cytophagales bacterium]